MKKFAIICAAAAVLAAPVAMADGHSGDKEHKGSGMFEKHDVDGDGFISQSEFMKAHEEKFNKKDVDGDGKISKDEMKAAHAEKREKRKEKRAKMKDKKQERVDGSHDTE